MKNEIEILYVSYDGILEPLGESQVLGYLERLSEEFNITLLTFEKSSDIKNKEKLSFYKEKLAQKKIVWIRRTYYSNPKYVSSFYNIISGIILLIFLSLRNRIKSIHVRSYIPGLIALPLVSIFKINLIFDIRGFWPEEKVDRAGWSREGLLFKIFKFLERTLIHSSVFLVTLTNESKRILKQRYPFISSDQIKVIPTCVNTQKFKPKQKKELKFDLVLGHSGSVHTAYNLVPILEMFKELLDSSENIRLYFFNKNDHSYIYNQVKLFSIPYENVKIMSVERNELASRLSEVDIGCFYANVNGSIKASFPTKIGEFLACGVPIVCNDINQDITDLIKENELGLIHEFKSSSYTKQFYDNLLNLKQDKTIGSRCQSIAKEKLSLSKGAEKYRVIYKSILESNG